MRATCNVQHATSGVHCSSGIGLVFPFLSGCHVVAKFVINYSTNCEQKSGRAQIVFVYLRCAIFGQWVCLGLRIVQQGKRHWLCVGLGNIKLAKDLPSMARQSPALAYSNIAHFLKAIRACFLCLFVSSYFWKHILVFHKMYFTLNVSHEIICSHK